MSLKEYWEGVCSNAKPILISERDLRDLFYSGENHPHMWWDRFEFSIENAFAVIDKYAGIQENTDWMNIRLLNLKEKAEFLVAMKINIEMQMNMVPMATTYALALVNYRNTVNQTFPDTTINNTRTRQRVQQTNTGRGGRGISGKEGRGGKGGRGGRGRGGWGINQHNDEL